MRRDRIWKATDLGDMTDVWNRLSHDGATLRPGDRDRFQAHVERHPDIWGDAMVSMAPQTASGRGVILECIEKVHAVADDAWRQRALQSLLSVAGHRSSVDACLLDAHLAIGFGSRRVLDAAIACGLKHLGDDDPIPDMWRGRAKAMQMPTRRADLYHDMRSDRIPGCDAHDLRMFSYAVMDAVGYPDDSPVGRTGQFLDCQKSRMILLNHADRCSDLGASTLARAAACLQSASGESWFGDNDHPMCPIALVADDWASMTAEDQQHVSTAALRSACSATSRQPRIIHALLAAGSPAT